MVKAPKGKGVKKTSKCTKNPKQIDSSDSVMVRGDEPQPSTSNSGGRTRYNRSAKSATPFVSDDHAEGSLNSGTESDYQPPKKSASKPKGDSTMHGPNAAKGANKNASTRLASRNQLLQVINAVANTGPSNAKGSSQTPNDSTNAALEPKGHKNRCAECPNMVFKDKDRLEAHLIREHNYPFVPCKYACGRVFYSSGIATRHERENCPLRDFAKPMESQRLFLRAPLDDPAVEMDLMNLYNVASPKLLPYQTMRLVQAIIQTQKSRQYVLELQGTFMKDNWSATAAENLTNELQRLIPSTKKQGMESAEAMKKREILKNKSMVVAIPAIGGGGSTKGQKNLNAVAVSRPVAEEAPKKNTSRKPRATKLQQERDAKMRRAKFSHVVQLDKTVISESLTSPLQVVAGPYHDPDQNAIPTASETTATPTDHQGPPETENSNSQQNEQSSSAEDTDLGEEGEEQEVGPPKSAHPSTSPKVIRTTTTMTGQGKRKINNNIAVQSSTLTKSKRQRKSNESAKSTPSKGEGDASLPTKRKGLRSGKSSASNSQTIEQ